MKKEMKVAILHDYLNQLGGAERVVSAILEIFPDAHLYTLLYDENKTAGLFKNNITKTSFLDFAFIRNNHRFFIPLMPLAAKLLKNNQYYDLVISSSAGYGKGIGVKSRYHLCYCHTPLRYAWEDDYLKKAPFLSNFFKKLAKPILGHLRNWDKNSGQRVLQFVANSNFIAEKINKYYGREAVVIYPPVDNSIFYYRPDFKTDDYYLMVGRLLYYKGFDLGISVFNELKKPLKIVGLGPEFEKLKKMANPRYIEFLGWVDDKRLNELYNRAKALIFPQIEDFGLVAAEAQACGLPVIALKKGGALEIIERDKTGVFFSEQSEVALIQAVKRFENMKFNRAFISQQAKRFSKENFKNNFLSLLSQVGLK